MILKLLLLAFVALFVGRLLFARKLKEMGRAADRTVNLCLIGIALYLLLQVIVLHGLS